MKKEELIHRSENIFQKYLGMPSRMISGSKSGYLRRNPENLVVFNSNIFIETRSLFIFKKYNKIWYGDVDLTLEQDKIKMATYELGKYWVYVLREMYGRFEYEDKPAIETYVYATNGIEEYFD